ncbi:MAG: FAD-dependent oxidoreductase [Candidatus Heimdallarchaeota archaeon]|nr:MAG: FAD-dependent oxidoreductase [Candidatus Heimdallarchaeota archaeon]
MKVVVIGGNPAGLSAASAIRRIHSDWEIDVYEKDQYVSYGACGIPYYVADEVKNLDQLITLTKEKLEEHRNIPVHLFHEVIKVDFEAKMVLVRDLKSPKEFNKPYDHLIIATGAKAKSDPCLDIDHPRIFKVHTLNHAEHLKSFLENNTIDSAVIIGSGYIGLEMLESYIAQGIKGEQISVIGPRLIFRSQTQKYVEAELKNYGVNLILQKRVKRVEPISDTHLKVILDDGQIITTDLIQISIGVVPATDMFKNTNLELLPNGAIITNQFMQTNIPDVYAAGDCASSYHQILKKNVYIPLAPAANKQGRIAGSYIAGKKDSPFPGVVGTAIYKVLDLYCATTGITQKEAKQLGYDAQFINIESMEIAHYYPGAKKMSVSLIFDAESHLLLGAEITAPSTLGAKKIDVFATALAAKMRIDDIQKLDLSYAPPFAPVWDPILIAANVARKKCR